MSDDPGSRAPGASAPGRDPPPEDPEERIDRLCAPLFDLWVRFERAFARVAIDRLDLGEEDAEACARIMEACQSESGRAFAYLLRNIRHERAVRRMLHMAQAVFEGERAAGGAPSMIGIDEIVRRYQRRKGDA